MDGHIALLQQDAGFRLWYLAGGFALMIAPMVAMSVWYHRGIGRSSGGRALMRRQNANRPGPRGSLLQAHAQLGEAVRMARDVSSGRYGADARRMQNWVYVLTGLWVVALILYFGVLLWADETAPLPIPETQRDLDAQNPGSG